MPEGILRHWYGKMMYDYSILGFKIRIFCRQEMIVAQVNKDYGIFSPGAKGEIDGVIKIEKQEIKNAMEVPAGALMLDCDPSLKLSRWMLGQIRYDLWDHKALIESNYSTNPVQLRLQLSKYTGMYWLVRSEISRVLRSVGNQKGFVLLHSGLVSFPQREISFLILGEKGGGKTSCCLSFLNLGGGKLITDELVLWDYSSSQLLMKGIPRRVGLSLSAFRYFPQYKNSPCTVHRPPYTNEPKCLLEREVISWASCLETIPRVAIVPRIRIGRCSGIAELSSVELARSLFRALEANALPSSVLYYLAQRLSQGLKGYKVFLSQDSQENLRTLERIIRKWRD